MRAYCEIPEANGVSGLEWKGERELSYVLNCGFQRVWEGVLTPLHLDGEGVYPAVFPQSTKTCEKFVFSEVMLIQYIFADFTPLSSPMPNITLTRVATVCRHDHIYLPNSLTIKGSLLPIGRLDGTSCSVPVFQN